jgi:hypothetical protein
MASVAGFNRNNGLRVPSVGGVTYGVTNAADRFSKTARGVGVRNVAGALRRLKRRAVSGFGTHNVRNPREGNNVRMRDAGGVRGYGRRRESEHGKR